MKPHCWESNTPHSLPHLRTLQVTPEVTSIVLWDDDEALLGEMLASQGGKVT
ncbi:MAG: hypothetical protein HC802_21900 [Caldilineaceae bacterium]|nr:hypothetical protein [Caldilineaceae bacterium]